AGSSEAPTMHHPILAIACFAFLAGSTFLAQEAKTSRGDEPLPPGAVARLGTLPFNYAETHSLLGFSPDSKQYFTYSAGSNLLHIWEYDSGRVLKRLPLPAGESIIAMSEDGKLLATWGEKAYLRVRVIDKAELLHSFPDHDKGHRPHQVAFSPTKRMLAAANENGGMRLYDLKTGKLLPGPLTDAKFPGATTEVAITALHFTPDEGSLIVCKPKMLPMIWDLKEQKVVDVKAEPDTRT